jgi:glycosyltransferase involved in cell wall biosynthesis
MSLEKPVIATDCGGNRELLSSAAVGWLVAPKQEAALAGAMREVIGDRDRSRAIGAAAREHVKRGFSREIRLDRLEDLYRSILAAR